MQLIEGTLVHSASDLNAFTECLRLTALDRSVAIDGTPRPYLKDPTAELLRRKGDEHERRYLEQMRETYGADLIEFENRSAATHAGSLAAEAATLDAMRRGPKMIYQAAFYDGAFRGRADFLRRVDEPGSEFGWSYEVIDTKLALSPKPNYLVQLCHYSEHLERLQGTPPLYAYVILGNGQERRFELDEFAAYYRRLKADYLSSIANGADAYPFECKHCSVCDWRAGCAKRRDADDHLSIVANMRNDQIAKLEDAGIETITALASAPDTARPKGMKPETFATLRSQANEQHRYRDAFEIDEATAVHSYSFREQRDANDGFARLPQPDEGDVFFDMEGDPLYRPDRPLEYLFGVYLAKERTYRAFWGKTPADERTAFEALVDFIVERRKTHPDLHVYHYAAYETAALKRLGGLFGSRENELDDFWVDETFVDLFPVVRQSVFISQPSYSIKKVEALYGFTRTTTTKGGDDSIVQFESWLDTGEQSILDDIEAYNEDDCRSTYELREWLVELRAKRNATLALPIAWRARPQPAAELVEAKAIERRSARDAEKAGVAALKGRLLDDLTPPDTLLELRRSSDARRARWLLGNLLEYHRREQKPDWWEHFHRLENVADLEEHDRKSIGGLVYRSDVPPFKAGERDQLFVHTYSYPAQEHDMKRGEKPFDPATAKSAGQIVEIGPDEIRIKVAKATVPEELRALIPAEPPKDYNKRQVVAQLAQSYVDGSLGRDFPATLSLLLNGLPRLRGYGSGTAIQPQTVTSASVTAVIEALDASYLPIQGPPGSGKSTNAAHAVLSLLARGKRVALAAQSHKALHNLCLKIEQTAYERTFSFKGCHKSVDAKEDSSYRSFEVWPKIVNAPTKDSFTECSLVSATTHAWADPEHHGKFDVVFIDEAGQVSLADALAVSLIARNVVLLGDPQQLPQVVQGSHPIGTDVSILQHLLGTSRTVSRERGIFLDTSYRMQPDIDRFVSDAFYDGHLAADPANAANRVTGTTLARSGLVFEPIEHDGNGRRSSEEASFVASQVAAFLDSGIVTLRDSKSRPLTSDDILVVAPYNMQRVAIEEALASLGIGGVRIGTVDKFQGQEAPIVFYSMATSNAELAPRGLDFLLSPNRFNVAISRSQAVSILVCSPKLLGSRAGSIEQMKLLSLLASYVESARAGQSCGVYSNRSATIGSSREAFAAG